MKRFTVSQIARRLSRKTGRPVSPQVISNFFYKRYLDDERCPVVGGSRLIPEDYLPTIELVLRERGELPLETAVPDSSQRQGLRARDIQPIGTAENSRVIAETAVDRIESELRRIDAERPGDA
jgi:hypothetical protein